MPRVNRKEAAGALGMGATILGLCLLGWGTLLIAVVPAHLQIGTTTFGVGVGITAFTLGMRHAFDADHIAAIDGVTRKLVADQKKPLSVGFWFSLGHSSAVLVLTILLSLGVRGLVASVHDSGSVVHQITSIVGPSVSGIFLYLLSAVNIVVLVRIIKVFLRMRTGGYDSQALERQLDKRGIANRLLGRLMRSIKNPRQMYGIGLLFGLGFDTATEVGLLVLAGDGATSELPWYAALCLPILFAAGMSLFDALDGSLMYFVYGWAQARPVRKVYYNMTVTGLSVIVALGIGTVELLSLLGDQLGLVGPLWLWVDGVSLGDLGAAVLVLFVLTWVVAIAVWKFGRVESRWAESYSLQIDR